MAASSGSPPPPPHFNAAKQRLGQWRRPESPGAPSTRFPALHLGHLALRGDEGVSQLERKGIKTKMI